MSAETKAENKTKKSGIGDLEGIREKIDRLDNRIHDTLIERAELIDDIVAVKRKQKLDFVHPAREAQMIRRLLSRHKGVLPPAAIVRIWRELVGAVSLMQIGLSVSVFDDKEHPELWDMARDYFGSVITMNRLSSPLITIASVREGESSFAVLPWPENQSNDPWWSYLRNRDQNMNIVCALPFATGDGWHNSYTKALVVSKSGFHPSDDDHSFIVLDTDKSVSRTRIVNVFEEMGLPALSLSSKVYASTDDKSLYLVEAGEYIGPDDPRLQDIESRFEDCQATVSVIGGYPVPPALETSGKNGGKGKTA